MIKILFVSDSGYPNPNIGGSNKVIYEILKYLNYNKFKPSFFSYDLYKDYNSPSDLYEDQIALVSKKRRLGYKLYEHFTPFKIFVSSIPYLKYYFKKRNRYFKENFKSFNRFDVIHIHDSKASFYFNLLSKPKKILTIHSKGSIVSEMKENLTNHKFYQNLISEFGERERIGCKFADLVTFPSNAAMEMFIEDNIITQDIKNKFKVIYNGVDIDSIENIIPTNIFNKYYINSAGTDYILLNIAQHIKPKNIDLLIKAVDIIKNKYKKNIILINAGKGYQTNELMELVNRLGLQNEVKFLGMIPNDDVIKLMKSCDCFVMPSERVVFDMVILEALVCKIPIIASNEGGNREIIINNVNGILLEELNEIVLCKKIMEIANKKNFKTNSSEFLEYDISRVVKRFEDLYD